MKFEFKAGKDGVTCKVGGAEIPADRIVALEFKVPPPAPNGQPQLPHVVLVLAPTEVEIDSAANMVAQLEQDGGDA